MTQANYFSSIRHHAAVLAIVAAGVPTAAMAQPDSVTPRQHFKEDRAACMAGRTTQGLASCLYEARSVLRDRLQGKLEMQVVDPGILAQNALARCEAVPQDAKDLCERLARGEGYREGSVAEGAVLMWLASADDEITVATLHP